MDRKAWIVITLCAAAMGLNFWWASKNQQAQAEAVRALEAQKAAEAAKAPMAPAPATVAATPAAPTATTLPPSAIAAAPGAPPMTAVPVPEEKHSITRGSVTYDFTSKGGGIARVRLAGTDHINLNEQGAEPIAALRRDATSLDVVPYKIVEKTDSSVTFEGRSVEGILVRKSFALTSGEKADDHLLGLTMTLTNQGTAPHKAEYYLYAGAAASLRPDEVRRPRFFWNDAGDAAFKDANSFAGGWFSKETTEFRQDFTKMRFGGVMSRFYTHIISNVRNEDRPGKIWASRFVVDHRGDQFKDSDDAKKDYGIQASIGMPPVDLAPGASQTLQYELYLGPKDYHRLRDLGGQRAAVMFYGMFTPISQFLTNIMRWLHGWSGNWGVAIILLTLFVRTCIWPIHAKSQYTMKRMGLLAPKMKELQEKYKAEPQKQQAEVMKLYREYGVNPLGGCLPMLLQLPIFFGFYSVLENAAELRGQPFLWVSDLSLPDTIYTILFPVSVPVMGYDFDINPLPLIMGVTMILQMKLTPQPASADKTQQRIFMLMPFFFLFICYNFAAALSLYWSTQNLFSIFQTWVMKLYMPEPKLEKVERRPAKAPAGQNPFFGGMNPGQKDKKGRNKPPKLGG